ncbi:MAG: hypothetical protein IT489_01880 [Gammaproteobacteria bacterium]|nr:hypothetical protein [Gammaproteobacteria bacterium]
MHPLIRVVCFLVFSACLAFGRGADLLCGALLLAAAYLMTSPRLLLSAARMVSRMRWFLLSLLIVYGWFTPGPPLFGDEGARFAALWPSREGLEEGVLRAALLAAIVAGANLLLRTTSREQMLLAVYGLARPLALFGVSRERVAVRMVLVIEALDPVRRIVTERMAAAPGGRPDLRSAGRFASGLMQHVVRESETVACGSVQLSGAGAPPPAQWVYPVLLWGLFYAVARMGG